MNDSGKWLASSRTQDWQLALRILFLRVTPIENKFFDFTSALAARFHSMQPMEGSREVLARSTNLYGSVFTG